MKMRASLELGLEVAAEVRGDGGLDLGVSDGSGARWLSWYIC